jgi:hypothetical protein
MELSLQPRSIRTRLSSAIPAGVRRLLQIESALYRVCSPIGLVPSPSCTIKGSVLERDLMTGSYIPAACAFCYNSQTSDSTSSIPTWRIIPHEP